MHLTEIQPGLHWKRHRTASYSFKMMSFSNINKQYGKQLLFVDASFQLNPGEKVGLVGPNGTGKTTLCRRGSCWCPETESNRHVLLGTRDFKSRASASFAIRAAIT